MADDKKYYYLKLKEDFYNDDAMLILQGMPDGYLYSDILMKLYLRSLKNNGKLMFNNLIPYTPAVLAQLVHHQVGTVEKAMSIFENLGLVEILDNGAIFMLNIQNYIGKSSTEADRKREYRARIEQEKQSLLCDSGQMSRQMTGQNSLEIEIRDRDKDKDNKKKEYKENSLESDEPTPTPAPQKTVSKKITKHKYGEYKHVLLSDDDISKLISKHGQEMTDKAIAHLDEYIEMKGYKAKNHYLAICKWVIDAVKEKEQKNRQKPAAVTKSAAAYNSYGQRQRTQNDYDALERMLLNQQSPPDTAGSNPDIKARAEALQERLRG